MSDNNIPPNILENLHGFLKDPTTTNRCFESATELIKTVVKDLVQSIRHRVQEKMRNPTAAEQVLEEINVPQWLSSLTLNGTLSQIKKRSKVYVDSKTVALGSRAQPGLKEGATKRKEVAQTMEYFPVISTVQAILKSKSNFDRVLEERVNNRKLIHKKFKAIKYFFLLRRPVCVGPRWISGPRNSQEGIKSAKCTP